MAPKDPAAVALGRRGGHARAKKMTPEQRSESARKAVEARWAKIDETLDQLEKKKAERRAKKKKGSK